jgi:hypothetical protein
LYRLIRNVNGRNLPQTSLICTSNTRISSSRRACSVVAIDNACSTNAWGDANRRFNCDSDDNSSTNGPATCDSSGSNPPPPPPLVVRPGDVPRARDDKRPPPGEYGERDRRGDDDGEGEEPGELDIGDAVDEFGEPTMIWPLPLEPLPVVVVVVVVVPPRGGNWPRLRGRPRRGGGAAVLINGAPAAPDDEPVLPLRHGRVPVLEVLLGALCCTCNGTDVNGNANDGGILLLPPLLDRAANTGRKIGVGADAINGEPDMDVNDVPDDDRSI